MSNLDGSRLSISAEEHQDWAEINRLETENKELKRKLGLYDELVEALEHHVSGCGLGFHDEELLKRVKELE